MATSEFKRAHLGITSQLILAILYIWPVTVIMSFSLSYIFGCPRWLELPWSELGDFVEGPEGRVYVSLGLYPAVLCYDRSGCFVASYPVPDIKHGIDLAVDEDGNLYCWAGEILIKNRDWDDVGEFWGPCEQWMLDESKRPVCVPPPGPWRPGILELPVNRVLTRPVKAGDVIFTGHGFRRSVFACRDGSTLERHGLSLLRKSEDGKLLATYGTAWYLQMARFPFPAILGWPALCLFLVFRDAYQDFRSHWRRK